VAAEETARSPIHERHATRLPSDGHCQLIFRQFRALSCRKSSKSVGRLPLGEYAARRAPVRRASVRHIDIRARRIISVRYHVGSRLDEAFPTRGGAPIRPLRPPRYTIDDRHTLVVTRPFHL